MNLLFSIKSIAIKGACLAFLLAVPFLNTEVLAQEPLFVQVKPISINRGSAGYFFAGATDERDNQGSLGYVFGSQSKKPLMFQGGVEKALQTYISAESVSDPLRHSIFIRLMNLDVVENEIRQGVVEGVVNLHLSFELLRNDAFSHLVDYQGGVSYKRSSHRTDLVEPAIGRAVAAALRYFDDWMGQEMQRNIKLVQGFRMDIVDYPVVESGDTVFYSRERPLVWEDFRDKPRMGSPFAATIFPSFAVEGDSEVVDGKVHLQMDLKIYMLKDASWVAADAKDPYTLNHEQRHFDLVKIVAERFRQRLLAMDIDPEDYDSVVNYEYLEAYREMNRIQAAYDEATAHGRNKSAQTKWNKLIDEVIEQEDYGRIDRILR